MEFKDLKIAILNNSLSDEPLILKYSDSKFLASTYINEICKVKNKKKLLIDSLAQMDMNDDFFEQEPEYIYVYIVDKLNDTIYPEMKNLIVLCKDITSEQDIDYIDVTKIVNWQIEDFVKVRLSGLTEEEIKWLCQITNYDIFRLDNECKKLEIFNKSEQEIVFTNLNNEDGYSDLNPMNIFNFSDAIIKKDYKLINDLLPYLIICDLEPLGVVTILLKKFKQIIALQMNPKATAASLGMSDKQFWYLKKNPNNSYNHNQLIRNVEFLSGIDYAIKSGNLDLSREELLDYIVVNVLR